MNLRILFAALLFLGLASICSADIHTAASCSQSDVQSAVNLAGDSDTVIIPSGTCTWTTSVAVDLVTGGSRALTIKGENDCTVDSKDRAIGCQTNITNFQLILTGADGKSFRLSNLQINGAVTGAIIYIYGSSKSWRFDHLFFNNVHPSSRVIWIGRSVVNDLTYGVFDSSTFINPGTTIFHYQPSADGGNLDWINDLGLGTADAIYLENNNFHLDSGMLTVTDCNGAGKFVVRYNDFHNAHIGAHDAIVVGLRGVRKWEVYSNNFVYDQNGNCWVAHVRGGTGVFFNNVITDPNLVLCGSGIQFVIYRNYLPGGNPWDSPCSNSTGKACLGSSLTYPRRCSTDADCSGISGACINIDGTSSSPNGYLCRDQAGTDGNNPQVSRPFLFWNNTKNGAPITVSVHTNSTGYVIADRDYCLSATTMPATCNGVSTVYAPFTFPHPLRLSDDSPTCGNNIVDPGEACDGSDLNNYSCSSFAGYNSGSISCKPDCSGYNISACVPGNTVRASTCSRNDVQFAIDSAATGDNVLVPAGTCTWGNGSRIILGGQYAYPSIFINKSVALLGLSPYIIGSGTGYLIVYTPSDFSRDWPLRISGFTFDGGGTRSGIYFSYSSTDLTIQDKIRIDHNIFQNFSGQAIRINGQRGVADNNIFVGTEYPIRFASGDDRDWWDNWEGLFFGKPDNNFYFEDNIIEENNIMVDCQYGNRYAFRYNTIRASGSTSYPLLDMHGDAGTAGGGCAYRSCFGSEIYGNYIALSAGYSDFRGGKHVVFNNFVSTTGNFWGLRDSESAGIEACECVYCSSTNEQPQHISDSYAWNNRGGSLSGSISPFFSRGFKDCTSQCGYIVNENDEYYNYNALFDGTSGVGCGTLANRPATCTQGVAYWATTQSCTDLTGSVGDIDTYPTRSAIKGTLYKCTSANTWTPYYIPLLYPHPLAILDNSTSYDPADLNQNGCIELSELLSFLSRWRSSSLDVSLSEVIDAIRLWKGGCP